MEAIWSVKIIVDCWVHAWSSLSPPIVGTAFRCHYIVFGSRPKAYVHEILQNQRHKPLPDGESVQPLSLLFHEQRSDVKLQPPTRIAKKMNKSGILFWTMQTWKTTIFFSYMPIVRIVIPEIWTSLISLETSDVQDKQSARPYVT